DRCAALCAGGRVAVGDFAGRSSARPADVTEAGCDPSRWRKSRPGAAYAAIEHVDLDRHTVAVKMFGPPTDRPEDENNDLKPAADSLPDQDGKLDAVTRAAFGEEYAAALEGGGRARGVATAARDVDEVEEHDDIEDQGDDDVEEPIVFTTPDDDPEITADIETPIPELEEDFALPTRTKGTRASAAQARAAVDSLLEERGA